MIEDFLMYFTLGWFTGISLIITKALYDIKYALENKKTYIVERRKN